MRKFRKSNKQSDEMSNYKFDGGTYEKKGENKVLDLISIQSNKGLPHSAFSVLADPYEEANASATPYPTLSSFNAKINATYDGIKNLDGGNAQQYSSSVRSKFLKYFDFMAYSSKYNYNYINDNPEIGDSRGKQLIDESRRAIAEALSVLQATTFTQMAIYDYAVITNMPMGSATGRLIKVKYGESTDPESGVTTDLTYNAYVYNDLTDVIYAALRYYQITLQKFLSVVNWHNSFRLKMGTMIRSSFNRETPNLVSLFGLFKKKSFLSVLDSMCLGFPGEYIDTQAMQQYNALTMIPSRRSNALTDPVLEFICPVNGPSDFILTTKNALPTEWASGDTKTFDIDLAIFSHMKSFSKPYSSGTDKHLDAAIEDIMVSLSAEDTMKWARQVETVPTLANNERFNSVKYNLDIVQLCMTTFKVAFSDVREVLDVVSRTGLVTWTKGYRPAITKFTDSPSSRNMIIDDIYRIVGGGPVTVELDAATKRWRTFSLWNMYDGIPLYDTWSGGAFLTFAYKQLDVSNDSDKLIEYIPNVLSPYNIWDKTNGVKFKMVNREGLSFDVTNGSVVMSSNRVLSRLVPLDSQDQLAIRVATANEVTDPVIFSMLYKTLTQVFGVCRVSGTNSSDLDYSLDPDVLAVYQIEIADITNEMINFSRLHSPFRGSVGSLPTIGFVGIK